MVFACVYGRAGVSCARAEVPGLLVVGGLLLAALLVFKATVIRKRSGVRFSVVKKCRRFGGRGPRGRATKCNLNYRFGCCFCGELCTLTGFRTNVCGRFAPQATVTRMNRISFSVR